MNQFKRAQIIMLESYTLSNITLFDKLYYNKQLYDPSSANNQHLYIISDDEIKEGDWKYNEKLNCITQHLRKDKGLLNELLKAANYCKKIIATTDTSLFKATGKAYEMVNGFKATYRNLPQPSQQFIEKYIEAYNKGEIITNVLVEYEYYNTKPNSAPIYGKFEEKLKVNSKENTITIKKLKNSWNRKEVIDILHKYGLNLIEQIENKSLEDQVDINQWIKENL